MNNKRKDPGNLEAKRIIFFQTGLIISLSLVLLAFEWGTTSISKRSLNDRTLIDAPIEMILVTTHDEKKKPPVPEPVKLNPIIDTDEPTRDFRIDVGIDPEAPVDVDFPPLDLQDEPRAAEEPIVKVAQHMPEFPGGLQALKRYLSKNLDYPREAREIGVEGVVYIGFVVEKDGRISNVELLRGIGFGCDEAALEAVRNMPKWIPGRQHTMTVRVQLSLPVKFNLR